MGEKPIVVLSDIPLTLAMQGYLSELADVVKFVHPGEATSRAIASAAENAVVCVSRVRPVTSDDMQRMKNVKMLSAWGVGYNHIDVSAATALGIPVCINPFFSRSVAEAAFTLVLALAKRLRYLMRDATTGRDAGHQNRGTEIRGKTLGVVGYGRIGREIADLGHCIGMQVVASDPYVQPSHDQSWCPLVKLEDLLAMADFVVLATSLTSETKNMIDQAELARMKPSAYLINVGRGSLVNEAALLTALQKGQIAGAGLDVWEHEPVAMDHPLLALDNVIGTPHRLAATWESLEGVCGGIAENVRRVLNGELPLNAVNPEVLADRNGG
jgi:phosphoglycerate dehydrogenase-like enzyme